MKTCTKLFFVALPVLSMVLLIPFVKNDYVLTLIYMVIIAGLFAAKKEKTLDALVFVFGFLVMTLFEFLFISTGVETFIRTSLFGVMPLWLPFLWGYGFVAIKTGVKLLETK